MPLEDLTSIGYEVARPVANAPITQSTVWGHGKQWWVNEGDDEEMVVTEARNFVKLHDKLVQAQTYFADNYVNWATMTAQQKDTANRNAQRAISNLVRNVLDDLSSEGI